MENIGIIIFIKENEFISKKVYFDETDTRVSNGNIILNNETIFCSLVDLYKKQILEGYHISYFFKDFSLKREEGSFVISFKNYFNKLEMVLNIGLIPDSMFKIIDVAKTKKDLDIFIFNMRQKEYGFGFDVIRNDRVLTYIRKNDKFLKELELLINEKLNVQTEEEKNILKEARRFDLDKYLDKSNQENKLLASPIGLIIIDKEKTDYINSTTGTHDMTLVSYYFKLVLSDEDLFQSTANQTSSIIICLADYCNTVYIPLDINLFQIRELKEKLQKIYENSLKYYYSKYDQDEIDLMSEDRLFEISYSGKTTSYKETLILLNRLNQEKHIKK